MIRFGWIWFGCDSIRIRFGCDSSRFTQFVFRFGYDSDSVDSHWVSVNSIPFGFVPFLAQANRPSANQWNSTGVFKSIGEAELLKQSMNHNSQQTYHVTAHGLASNNVQRTRMSAHAEHSFEQNSRAAITNIHSALMDASTRTPNTVQVYRKPE